MLLSECSAPSFENLRIRTDEPSLGLGFDSPAPHRPPRGLIDAHVIDVFVSRPTWVAGEFRHGLEGFLRLLAMLDLNPRTLGTTDYPRRAPLDEVISLMEQCRGAVILGYPQIRITGGTVKDEPLRSEVLLPTEWNHIEAGLAYARGLPLLVIHHLRVVRGIFDRGAVSAFLYERDLRQPDWPLAEDVQGAVSKWKQDCLLTPAERERDSAERTARGQLRCPNCSSRGQLSYLSPIPKDFVALEGATHECTHCGYKRPL